MGQRPFLAAPIKYYDGNGVKHAALVVKVWNPEEGLVNLWVFPPDGATDLGAGAGAPALKTSVLFGDGDAPVNAWSW